MDTSNRKEIVNNDTIRSKMIIISECLYSAKNSKEIVKRTSQIAPLPKFLSVNGPYTRFITKYRIKSITIYEFDGQPMLTFKNILNQILKIKKSSILIV